MPEWGTHKIERADGAVIGEYPTETAARKVAYQCERDRVSYRWSVWAGERTGWNVCRGAFFDNVNPPSLSAVEDAGARAAAPASRAVA